MGEKLCDEDSFDLVPDLLGDSTASYPQFDMILGLHTEAVQHNAPDLRWEGQRER